MARDRISLGMGKAGGLALLAALGLCAGCAPAGPPQSRSDTAPTIVSLNPCLDAILVEIASPGQVLALSHYSRDPGSSSIPQSVAARFGVTGGTAEEVIALRPDVVLASTFLPQPTRTALERAGLRVETFGSPGSLAESLQQIRQVAGLTGQQQAGDQLARQIGATSPPEIGRRWSVMLWQPDQIVAGEQALVSEHLRWAGFDNHSAKRGLGQADYVSLESLLADPPDILLVAGSARGQTHPLLKAQRGMLVAEFDPNLLYCGGPTIPRARARLIAVREQFEREIYRAQFP